MAPRANKRDINQFTGKVQENMRAAEHLIIQVQRISTLDPESAIEGLAELLLEARRKLNDALLSLQELEQRLLRDYEL